MKKIYCIKVKEGSPDEFRVKRYLNDIGIRYDVNHMPVNLYIGFRTGKKTWKQIRKDLGLSVEYIYCTFKKLS